MRQLNAIQSGPQGNWESLLKSGIEVVNLTASKSATLDRMYPPQALNIFSVTSRPADAARVADSRIADTPPFNGGTPS